MTAVPSHRPGDIFQNTPRDLEEGSRVATIGRNGGPYDFGQFARGYFAAAHQLLVCDVPTEQLEHLPLETQTVLRVSVELKLYPILYCYRHAIELAIKHLLLQIPRHFGEPQSAATIKGHSLETLWNQLLPYLHRLSTDLKTSGLDGDERGEVTCREAAEKLRAEELANVASIISEVNSVDEASISFRYALDLSGAVPLERMHSIVLDKLYHFMLPISEWFEAVIFYANALAGPMPESEPGWLQTINGAAAERPS